MLFEMRASRPTLMAVQLAAALAFSLMLTGCNQGGGFRDRSRRCLPRVRQGSAHRRRRNQTRNPVSLASGRRHQRQGNVACKISRSESGSGRLHLPRTRSESRLTLKSFSCKNAGCPIFAPQGWEAMLLALPNSVTNPASNSSNEGVPGKS